MKKVLFIFFLTALLLLSGCAGSIEGEYEVVTDHTDSGSSTQDDSSVRVVGSFAEMTNAMKSFIDSATEYGVIKAVDYSGSLDNDFSKACKDVTWDYPMGVYAVDYISSKITPILSYYEIEVFITYKLTEAEIDSVISVKSTYDYYSCIDNALKNYENGLTVEIANLSVNEDNITRYIRQYYKDNPDLLMENPEVSIVFYPSPPEDYVEKIIKIQFTYKNTDTEMKDRKAALRQKTESMISDIGSVDSEVETALKCVENLSLISKFSRSGDTAYDAIVKGSADSEGYAMAYKLLCKSYGLYCTVVEGKKDGELYSWNIVGIDGDYYHVDPLTCDRFGVEAGFLKKDSEMWGTYWWDIEQYEECSGSLSYKPEESPEESATSAAP